MQLGDDMPQVVSRSFLIIWFLCAASFYFWPALSSFFFLSFAVSLLSPFAFIIVCSGIHLVQYSDTDPASISRYFFVALSGSDLGVLWGGISGNKWDVMGRMRQTMVPLISVECTGINQTFQCLAVRTTDKKEKQMDAVDGCCFAAATIFIALV